MLDLSLFGTRPSAAQATAGLVGVAMFGMFFFNSIFGRTSSAGAIQTGPRSCR
jgi:hypothetical protein